MCNICKLCGHGVLCPVIVSLKLPGLGPASPPPPLLPPNSYLEPAATDSDRFSPIRGGQRTNYTFHPPILPTPTPLPPRSHRSAIWRPDLSWCPPPEDSPPPPRRLLGPAALQNAPSSHFRESGLSRCVVVVGRGRTFRCSITSCNSLTYYTRVETLLPIWIIGKLYFLYCVQKILIVQFCRFSV